MSVSYRPGGPEPPQRGHNKGHDGQADEDEEPAVSRVAAIGYEDDVEDIDLIIVEYLLHVDH